MHDLSNENLLDELRGAVGRERKTCLEVLRYLREVEDRRLFSRLGYTSLFEFCRRELKYSESGALLRIHAMRLMRDEPSVEEKLGNGKISLSVAARVENCFRRQEPSTVERAEILEAVTDASRREADRIIAERFPEEPRGERERPLSGDLTEIRFTVTKDVLAKFEKLKELTSHKNYAGRYDILFEQLADIALKKLDPEQKSQKKSEGNGKEKSEPKAEPKAETKAKDAAPHGPGEVRSRYIPAATKNEVWLRDRGRCQWKSDTGEFCHSKHGLQYDHIKPFADGGANDANNLRLYCGVHNRARHEYAS